MPSSLATVREPSEFGICFWRGRRSSCVERAPRASKWCCAAPRDACGALAVLTFSTCDAAMDEPTSKLAHVLLRA